MDFALGFLIRAKRLSHVIITLTFIFQEASISSDKHSHFICFFLIVYVSLLNSCQELTIVNKQAISCKQKRSQT